VKPHLETRVVRARRGLAIIHGKRRLYIPKRATFQLALEMLCHLLAEREGVHLSSVANILKRIYSDRAPENLAARAQILISNLGKPGA
jgi:hypothetical protein